MHRWSALAVAALFALSCGTPSGSDGGSGGGSGGSGGSGGGTGGGSGGGTGGGSGGGSGGGTGGGSGGGTGGGSGGGTGGGSGGGSGGGTGGGGTSSLIDAGTFYSYRGYQELSPLPGNESCDLEVDSTGRLHVVTNVTNVADGGLYYGLRETDAGWTVERIVGSVGSQAVGTGVKIELDSTGKPRVAFTSADLPGIPTRTRLFYASKLTGSWQIEEIEDAGFQESIFFGFAVDPSDTSHLGYRIRNAVFPDGGLSSVVRYASKTTGGWTLETVLTENFINDAPALAVTPGGIPHLFYIGNADAGVAGPYSLLHGWRSPAGVWSQEAIYYPSTTTLSKSSTAIAAGDVPMIGADNNLFTPSTDGGFWPIVVTNGIYNVPFMSRAPSGAIYDFSADSYLNGSGLIVGRYANGRRSLTFDAGVSGVGYSGWGYDSAGHPWGAVNLSGAIYVIRLD